MSSADTSVRHALLEAGADPMLHSRQGRTAGKWFRAEGLKEQADLLDAAMRGRSGPAGAEPSAPKKATQP